MCMYCERNGRDWEQIPPLPYMEQNRKDGQSVVTGNMINPMTTIAVIRDYRSKQPELVILDRSFFLRYHNDPAGIGTVYVPIKFCPECGRRLGKADPGAEKVSGISEKLRSELWELHNGGCADSDIEDFIRDKRLSRAKAGAVWTQIYVWMAPDCCKGCRHVWQWRNCHCSRKYSDKYEPRNGESV